jgi:RimJ/RimL family protein N-acetyltransferase
MNVAPVISTERLLLRGHRLEDLDPYTALWADETVVRFIGGQKLNRNECWTRLLRAHGMWSLLGYSFWIIEDRITGTLIGEAGVMDAKRDLEPSLDGTLEAGWVLHPAYHGKGLAREAMTAVLDWADTNFPAMPQSCIIEGGNVASLRLAQHLGFQEIARSDVKGSQMRQFRRFTCRG